LTELAVPIKKPKRDFSTNFLLRSAAFAAIAVIGIAIAVHILRPLLPVRAVADSQFYSTDIGEQRPVALADGSTVLLNTDSRLQVEYDAERREVHLLQGEAYFEVAHDSDKPFLVFVGSNIVRAVGTSFTVHIKKLDIEVIVTEGAVEVSAVGNQAKPLAT
jgi:transmembrane sensor